MSSAALKRSFVPHDADPGKWDELEPLYQALLDREINSVNELEKWLGDVSELTAVTSEYGALRHIEQACHTDDAQIERAFLDYVENIAPKIKPRFFELQQKFLASGYVDELADERYHVLVRDWRNDVELFREKNVALQTELTKLASEYDKLNGAMEVEFRGRHYTLQQLGRFAEETDRPTRAEAWQLATARRLADREDIDAIFGQMLELRGQVAANAQLTDFRAWSWKALGRFDYEPAQCLEFGDAIAEICVPQVERLDIKRRAALGVAQLRPWDLAVDVKGRSPLRPFAQDAVSELVAKCAKIFGRLDPALANDYAQLQFGRNFDLDSRKGKRAGGFQASLEESAEPFIFMNAAGMQRDVETMLHEAGHAFHYMWSRHEPLVFLRHAPIEFCEVASMAMELMSADGLDEFYDSPEDHQRARGNMLEGIIRFFPWMAIIDGFGHWLYTHTGHTLEQRTDAWVALLDRFQSKVVDYTGLDDARQVMWHRQLHLFHHPFYYVEYGIAQLGALQLWMQYREDTPGKEGALANYRKALALGGRLPLPQLFEAAGIRFDFTSQTLGPLIEMLVSELEQLSR